MSTLSIRYRRRLALLMLVATAVFFVPWHGFTLPLWLFEMQSGLVVSHAITIEPVVALSFDDGPDPTYTPRVLEILKRYGAKATFFEEGRMIRLYPDLARRVLAEGHIIGNHSETHPYMDRLSHGEVRSEIKRCDDALRSFVGIQTDLFRPPRGDWNPTIFQEVESQHKHIVLWSVAMEHQAAPLPQEMADRVLTLIKPGGVILMHDGANRSRESTVEALPLLLEGLKARGFRFVTIPELFGFIGDAPIPEATNPRSSH